MTYFIRIFKNLFFFFKKFISFHFCCKDKNIGAQMIAHANFFIERNKKISKTNIFNLTIVQTNLDAFVVSNK